MFQPSPDVKLEGKVFVKEDLGLNSSEISFNMMQPGDALPFLHKHNENEEIYLSINCEAQMLLNAEISLKKKNHCYKNVTNLYYDLQLHLAFKL